MRNLSRNSSIRGFLLPQLDHPKSQSMACLLQEEKKSYKYIKKNVETKEFRNRSKTVKHTIDFQKIYQMCCRRKSVFDIISSKQQRLDMLYPITKIQQHLNNQKSKQRLNFTRMSQILLKHTEVIRTLNYWNSPRRSQIRSSIDSDQNPILLLQKLKNRQSQQASIDQMDIDTSRQSQTEQQSPIIQTIKSSKVLKKLSNNSRKKTQRPIESYVIEKTASNTVSTLSSSPQKLFRLKTQQDIIKKSRFAPSNKYLKRNLKTEYY